MLCRLQRLYAGLYAISARCTYCVLPIYKGVVHRTLPIISAQCAYYAVPIYQGIIHRTLTTLLRGYLLHMRYHVLRCGSREYPTFHYSK
jgi:hypothetical protein